MSQSKQPSEAIVGAGLSAEATNILVKNVNTKTMAGAGGTDVDDLVTDVVTLSLLIVDESYSMSDDETQVKSEIDASIEAIKDSSQRDEILLSIWAFNSRTRLIHSYLSLDLVEPFTDYHPQNNTALYDSIIDGLTGLVKYEAELKAQGWRVKLNVGVVTDGDDNESRHTAAQVKTVVEELRRKRENATFALIALGNDVDETVLAASMGFPDPKRFDKTPQGRRRAFGTWSSSVIKTSQTQIGTASGSLFQAP